MASPVRSSWFGREISVLLTNGKWLSGELTEVSDMHILLNTKNGETQIMAHAMMVVRLAEESQEE